MMGDGHTEKQTAPMTANEMSVEKSKTIIHENVRPMIYGQSGSTLENRNMETCYSTS